MIFSGLKNTEEFNTVANGLWRDHPIFSMVLGICSALAVSNTVANAIAMSAGVTFVLTATAIIISLLRKLIPTRVRIITFMIVIASFVIIVDKVIEAFFPGISESLGPYIGLIITNCILMGRAEAFYAQNNVHLSILDALSNGVGYTYTLVSIAIIREALGFGTILGIRVMPAGWTNWVIMAMAPGAFFILSVFIWLSRTLAKIESE